MNTQQHEQTMIKIDDVNNIKLELGDRLCDYNDGYICDIITEIADNDVDIYYNDLFEWCKHNYKYVEEAIAQGLCDFSSPDIPKMIQAGQYEYNTQILYDELDEAILNWCLNYIKYDLELEEITKEQYEEIENKCTNVDSNDRIEEYSTFINELLAIEE